MESLNLVFQKMAVWIGEFLHTCSQYWLLTIALFLFVLGGIINVLVAVRGGKK